MDFSAAGSSANLMSNPDVERSYEYCDDLARREARNFYPAFRVLPRDQRRGMNALYAFMRVTDDLADDPGPTARKRADLAAWRAALDASLSGRFEHPLHPALADTLHRFSVPLQYLHDVIDGVTLDLEPVEVQNFDELYRYCYLVASAVGLACIHIWGFRGEAALKDAEAAGIALQLTNILRDLTEDRDRGRIYLPREELERFQALPESWSRSNSEFQELMRFQVSRARDYYRRGEALIPRLSPSGRAVFHVILRTYWSLLDAIERRNFDVFSERVRVSSWRKMQLVAQAIPLRWGLFQ